MSNQDQDIMSKSLKDLTNGKTPERKFRFCESLQREIEEETPRRTSTKFSLLNKIALSVLPKESKAY